MLIRLDVLQIIERFSAEVPLHTPNRTVLIHEQVQEYCNQFNSPNNYVKIAIISPYTTFIATLECVQILLGKLPRICLEIEQYFYGSTVLVPPELSCCKSKYRIDPRHATIKLYDIHGVNKCLYFHGRCNLCKTSYYYNYIEKEDHRLYREFQDYFVVASGVGFSKRFLDEVSLHITIGNESFEKIAEIYNYKHSLYSGENMMKSDLLEENWLLYRILSVCKDVRWDRKMENSHYYTEKICLQLYPAFKEKVDSRWLKHTCNEIGCNKRIVVIDGNEKLYRYCCSQPFEKVISNESGVLTKSRCINNPKRGNKCSSGSKFCELHLSGNPSPVHTIEQLDLRPVTRKYTRNLKEEIVSGFGCKSIGNVNKFTERTAGMIYLIRPCGIRLSHKEMYTAESLSSVFTSLIDVFTAQPDESDITGIVYDRACDLSPYIEKLAGEGNVIAGNYTAMKYIVDPFHAEKHTMAKCDITSPECKFHPDLDIYKDVRNMNMEVCEQSFHLINPIKHISRNMTYGKRLCFLKIIDNDYNFRLSRKLK